MSKTGLTLLEILVAALIMALVMTGLTGIFVAGKRHILHARSKMQGGELGRLFLAPLQMQVKQSEWDNNCLSNSALCGSQITRLDGVDYTATTATFPVSGTTLRKVTVTINWNESTP